MVPEVAAKCGGRSEEVWLANVVDESGRRIGNGSSHAGDGYALRRQRWYWNSAIG
jgi:hypothetical protein